MCLLICLLGLSSIVVVFPGLPCSLAVCRSRLCVSSACLPLSRASSCRVCFSVSFLCLFLSCVVLLLCSAPLSCFLALPSRSACCPLLSASLRLLRLRLCVGLPGGSAVGLLRAPSPLRCFRRSLLAVLGWLLLSWPLSRSSLSVFASRWSFGLASPSCVARVCSALSASSSVRCAWSSLLAVVVFLLSLLLFVFVWSVLSCLSVRLFSLLSVFPLVRSLSLVRSLCFVVLCAFCVIGCSLLVCAWACSVSCVWSSSLFCCCSCFARLFLSSSVFLLLCFLLLSCGSFAVCAALRALPSLLAYVHAARALLLPPSVRLSSSARPSAYCLCSSRSLAPSFAR